MSEVKEYNIERPGHFIDWQPSCTNIACALRMPRNGRWRSFWPSSELLMMHEGKLFSFIPCIPQCVVKKKVSVFRLNLSTNMANDAAAAAFKLETEKEWRNCMLHEPGQSFVKHFRQPFSIYGCSEETNRTVKRESINSKVMLQSEQACRSLSFLIPFVLMSISSVSTCQWFVVFQMGLKVETPPW